MKRPQWNTRHLLYAQLIASIVASGIYWQHEPPALIVLLGFHLVAIHHEDTHTTAGLYLRNGKPIAVAGVRPRLWWTVFKG